MQDSASEMPLDEATMAIVSGSIGKSLGIDPADLRVGLDVAKAQIRRGAPAEAFRTYVALVLCEPGNTDFQIGLANCALELGENHLALQAASAVIALEPTDPRGYYLSGRACFAIGAFLEAEEDLTDAQSYGRKARDAVLVEAADKILKTIAIMKATGTESARANA